MENELRQFQAAKVPEDIQRSGKNLQTLTRNVPDLRDADEALRMLVRQSSENIAQIVNRVRPSIIRAIQEYVDRTKKVVIVPATETVGDMSGSSTVVFKM